MRRDQDGNIVHNRQEIYRPLSHQISINNGIDTKWECIYEQVSVITDAGNELTAWKYCQYGRLNCYETANETDDTLVILKDHHPHIAKQREIINQQFNAYQNCFGFCVLDGQFWLDLTIENVQRVIDEENYIDVEDLTQDHLIIYYQENKPVHIAKFKSESNQYQHKIGCNCHVIRENNDISDVYGYNRVRLISKQ